MVVARRRLSSAALGPRCSASSRCATGLSGECYRVPSFHTSGRSGRSAWIVAQTEDSEGVNEDFSLDGESAVAWIEGYGLVQPEFAGY